MRIQKWLWGFAAVFALLGTAAFGVSALRFSGALCWGCAMLLIVFAALDLLKKRQPWAKWAERVLLALTCLGVLCFGVLEARVIAGAHGTPGAGEPACVIVLGAGVDGTQPSLTLRTRLDAALAYIADKPDVPIIVSGCQGLGEQISEAECMDNYLRARGVDASRIWKEEQASSTRTNFTYSLALMAERGLDADAPIAVVTSDYHMARSRFIAKHAGVAAERVTGVPASLPKSSYYNLLTANYYVREAFALANEMLFRMDLDL